MALQVDQSLLGDMKAYGAFDISACFNCGNCTAVCPLSKDSTAFPRRVIRYAQLGQAEHVAASREVWLCYYCAECSDTCPRQAEPGQFMMAARRFAIARFDPFGLARRLYRSPLVSVLTLVLLGAAILAALLAGSPGWPQGRTTTAALLEFVPYEVIHYLGLGVVVAVVAIVAATLVNMFWRLSRAPAPGGLGVPVSRPQPFPLAAALRALRTTVVELLGQRRYRDCDSDRPDPGPLVLRRWLVHYAIMGGMVGLAAATALDYLFKTPGSYVPIYSPIRLLGTVAGLALMYGATVALVQRLRKPDKYYATTLLSDWLLLAFLWLLGLTGFVLEAAEYATLGPWVGVVFLVHITLAFELILLLPFTKLAHLVYRPAAIWFEEFRRERAG